MLSESLTFQRKPPILKLAKTTGYVQDSALYLNIRPATSIAFEKRYNFKYDTNLTELKKLHLITC